MAQSNRPSPTELQGVYLRAMQEISKSLMENLPAGEELWRTLTQAELLLLEAQQKGVSTRQVFGSGGIAGFCQAIIDEFRTDIAGKEAGVMFTPASKDKSVSGKAPKRDPRGGVRYPQLRIGTRMLAVLLVFACLGGALWYIGIWNYLFGGTSYYLVELRNFADTITPLKTEPVQLTLNLKQNASLDYMLYADASERTVQLTSLDCERLTQYNVLETGDHGAQKWEKNTCNSWYIRLQYRVDSSFTAVAYVEPELYGASATVTFSDGTALVSKLSIVRSGAATDGYEYMEIRVADIPEDASVEGAVITLYIPDFRLVEWTRLRTGRS